MPLLTDPTDSLDSVQRGLETRSAVFDGREFEAPVPHNLEDIAYAPAPEQNYSHSPELETAHAAQVAHEYAIPGQEHYAPAPQPAPEVEQPPVHAMEYANQQDLFTDVTNNTDAVMMVRLDASPEEETMSSRYAQKDYDLVA